MGYTVDDIFKSSIIYNNIYKNKRNITELKVNLEMYRFIINMNIKTNLTDIYNSKIKLDKDISSFEDNILKLKSDLDKIEKDNMLIKMNKYIKLKKNIESQIKSNISNIDLRKRDLSFLDKEQIRLNNKLD